MSYRGIFFRASEIEKLQSEYSFSTDKIFAQAQNRFSNISSLDQLYLRVGQLENSEEILSSFHIKTQNSYLQRGSIQDSWIDPFTQSPDEVYGFNLFGSEFIFYLTFVVLFTFIVSCFSKFKSLKVMLVILLFGLVITDIVNWQIVEPNKIAKAKENIDLNKYKDHLNDMFACKIFDSLYTGNAQIKNRKFSDSSNYTYDVVGQDSEGNNVNGTVDVDSESGSGNIIVNGEEKYITVEWEGKGELIGHDENGNTYNLEVN